jgi:hypothetical protein
MALEASCAASPVQRKHPWKWPRTQKTPRKWLDHSTLTPQPLMEKCLDLGGKNSQFGNGNIFELA